MRDATLTRLLGFSADEVEDGAVFRLFVDDGDGPQEKAEATSFIALCQQLEGALFGGDFPAYDEDIIAVMPTLPGEPLSVRALLYELSESMQRTRDGSTLGYLSSVLDTHPHLQLVIAWEAAPPRQDFAVGIFRTA